MEKSREKQGEQRGGGSRSYPPVALASVILAAGKGVRMGSDLPKVLHTIAKKPLLAYVVELARVMDSIKTVVVVGHKSALVRAAFPDAHVVFVEQTEQLGTAHAVEQARGELADFEGDVLILCGDAPLFSKDTMWALLACHRKNAADVTVMTTKLRKPGSYGRVVKDATGNILKIVEFRDASSQEKELNEINTGIYCIRSSFLFEALAAIGNDNQQREYYLTDIIAVARNWGRRACAFVIKNPYEAIGINTKYDLALARAYFFLRKGKCLIAKILPRCHSRKFEK